MDGPTSLSYLAYHFLKNSYFLFHNFLGFLFIVLKHTSELLPFDDLHGIVVLVLIVLALENLAKLAATHFLSIMATHVPMGCYLMYWLIFLIAPRRLWVTERAPIDDKLLAYVSLYKYTVRLRIIQEIQNE